MSSRVRYTIHVKGSARRGMKPLPAPVRAELVRAIDGLAENPRPPGTRKLEGPGSLYRLRVAGSYRIVWQVDDRTRTVVVARAGHRRDVYRGL